MTNGTKFCPNCGAELDANAKFCTTCGFNLVQESSDNNQSQVPQNQPQANPQPQQTAPMQTAQSRNQQAQPNPTLQAAQYYSKNYFTWFLDTLLHPTASQEMTQRYFGIVSLVIPPILLMLTLVLTINRVFQQFGNRLANAFSSTSKAGAVIGFGGGLKLLFWFLILTILYVGVAYGAGIVANNNQRLNFFTFTNRFAALTNSMIVTSLLLFLTSFTINYSSQMATPMSFASDFYLPLFLLSLTSMIFQIAFVMVILPAPTVISKIGVTYIIVVAQLLVSFVIYLVINGQIWHWIDEIKAMNVWN